MSQIWRRIPKTNIARRSALNSALLKAMNPGTIGNFLTATTFAKLQAITPLYNTAMDALGPKEAALYNNTVLKYAALKKTKTNSLLFAKGINLGIELGLFDVGSRALYGLPVSSGRLPRLFKASAIRHFAELLVTGEGQRVAAGGTPASYPAISLVANEIPALKTHMAAESNLKDDLDNAQEAVSALNKEASRVILKVWDEVDTFFDHEAAESKRANCREWGVVYISRGRRTPVTFHITGLSEEELLQSRVTMEQTGRSVAVDIHGTAICRTEVVGPVVFIIGYPGKKKEVSVVLQAGEPKRVEVVMD